jgi:glycosyltransferase involved in cell wall biosynthesis
LEKVSVSVIIPAYNQRDRLEGCVRAVQQSLKAAGIDGFEVILAEDGSTDGSFEEANRLWRKYAFVRVSHANTKTGKGRALCRSFAKARGSIFAYVDADQATETSHLPALIAAAQRTGIATGSRYLRSSRANRTVRRLVFSRVYNWLVRVILGSTVSDHQCGFKAFRAGLARELCVEAREMHWFWDTEVLVLAQRKGMMVAEIPVVWREQGETTVRFKNDIWDMFWGIIRLKSRLDFRSWR